MGSRDMMRELFANRLTNEFFKQKTNKTLGQLWYEMTGRRVSNISPIVGLGGQCLFDDTFTGSNQYLTNGNPIVMYSCFPMGQQNWAFNYTPGASGAGSIHVAQPGTLAKCIDVKQSGTASGTPVWIWDCNGTAAQQWVPQPNGLLVNPNSGKCLDAPAIAANGGRPQVQIKDCSDSANQKWTTPQLSGEIIGILGKCLDDDRYGTNNGNVIKIYPCGKNSAQDWSLVPYRNNGGGVALRVLGKCLDVKYAGKTNGTPAWLWDCNGGLAQEWVPRGDGTLYNPNARKCLETVGGKSADSTSVQIWDCNAGAWQKWNISQIRP